MVRLAPAAPSRADLLRRGWLQATWKITSGCDLACAYCRSTVQDDEERPRRAEASDVAAALNRHGERWVVGITGGEPLTLPGLVETCRELIRPGFKLVLDSNLNATPKVRELAQGLDPADVLEVHATAHLTEAPWPGGVERFGDNVSLLRERGFRVMTVAVLHPSPEGVHRYLEARRTLDRRGILLVPKPLKGQFRGREYPSLYSDRELALIIRHRPFVRFYPFPSSGLPCNAGRSFVQITEGGEVTRCVGDRTVIGDVAEGFELESRAQPCEVERCPCFGHDLLAGGGLSGAARRLRLRWALHARLKRVALRSVLGDALERRLRLGGGKGRS